VKQHGGADADRDAVDGRDDGLGIMRQRIENFVAFEARGVGIEVPAFRKSSDRCRR
jgi:hypothetical protein